MAFDLTERTFKFYNRLVSFLKTLPKDPILHALVMQVVRSGTSIGANYREADRCESRKDFLHKMMICKKDAKENLYWLGIIQENGNAGDEMVWLITECSEFVKIFGKITSGR